MDVYLYRADLHCEKCGEEIKAKLKAPANVDDESSFDSDDYPKGPYSNGGGESDSPQHCGTCGVFLENPLTSDGFDYLQEAMNQEPETECVKLWKDFYSEAMI